MTFSEIARYMIESKEIPDGVVAFVGTRPRKSCISMEDLASDDWSVGVLPPDGIESDDWWKEHSTQDLEKIIEIFTKSCDEGVGMAPVPRKNLMTVINNCSGVTCYGASVVKEKLSELIEFLQGLERG